MNQVKEGMNELSSLVALNNLIGMARIVRAEDCGRPTASIANVFISIPKAGDKA